MELRHTWNLEVELRASTAKFMLLTGIQYIAESMSVPLCWCHDAPKPLRIKPDRGVCLLADSAEFRKGERRERERGVKD
jgi:hypothetical protein